MTALAIQDCILHNCSLSLALRAHLAHSALIHRVHWQNPGSSAVLWSRPSMGCGIADLAACFLCLVVHQDFVSTIKLATTCKPAYSVQWENTCWTQTIQNCRAKPVPYQQRYTQSHASFIILHYSAGLLEHDCFFL